MTEAWPGLLNFTPWYTAARSGLDLVAACLFCDWSLFVTPRFWSDCPFLRKRVADPALNITCLSKMVLSIPAIVLVEGVDSLGGKSSDPSSINLARAVLVIDRA